MASVKLEYIWLDGCQSEPNLRSKTKILDEEAFGATLDEIFMWYYDGAPPAKLKNILLIAS